MGIQLIFINLFIQQISFQIDFSFIKETFVRPCTKVMMAEFRNLNIIEYFQFVINKFTMNTYHVKTS